MPSCHFSTTGVGVHTDSDDLLDTTEAGSHADEDSESGKSDSAAESDVEEVSDARDDEVPEKGDAKSATANSAGGEEKRGTNLRLARTLVFILRTMTGEVLTPQDLWAAPGEWSNGKLVRLLKKSQKNNSGFECRIHVEFYAVEQYLEGIDRVVRAMDPQAATELRDELWEILEPRGRWREGWPTFNFVDVTNLPSGVPAYITGFNF